MADYADFLVDLKAKRAALDEERVELETLIKGVERLVSRAGGGPPRRTLAARSLSGLTMPEAVKGYFQSLSALEPQTTRQIVDGVKAGGLKGGKNLRGHVYNTLHRLSQDDGPFVHHKDGRWSLREWGLPVGE